VAYSLQAIKHLTADDGGILLCPTEEQTEKARLLRWYGIDRTHSTDFRCEHDIAEWGYKFHMNDINAVIGLANLELLEDTVSKHRDNASYYREALSRVPGITLLEEASNRTSAYWLFTLRAENRDGLQTKLRECGIACGRVHERNDRYSCMRSFRDRELPGTDVMHREMLCIPVGWWVSEENRDFIAKTIREGW
jgi:dTDP-4-amino-4,6-dideoxygalactose transaminase